MRKALLTSDALTLYWDEEKQLAESLRPFQLSCSHIHRLVAIQALQERVVLR